MAPWLRSGIGMLVAAGLFSAVARAEFVRPGALKQSTHLPTRWSASSHLELDGVLSSTTEPRPVKDRAVRGIVNELRGGGFFSGMNPFGYKLTRLGEKFLEFEGSRDCDVGRFLASLKSTLKGSRKTSSALKSEWLELVRYAKTAEASRIYRNIDDFVQFALNAGLID